MALAQVQSLVEADQPHPPIGITAPTETVMVHIQPDVVSPVSVAKQRHVKLVARMT